MMEDDDFGSHQNPYLRPSRSALVEFSLEGVPEDFQVLLLPEIGTEAWMVAPKQPK
jgi:hypothetical protein